MNFTRQLLLIAMDANIIDMETDSDIFNSDSSMEMHTAKKRKTKTVINSDDDNSGEPDSSEGEEDTKRKPEDLDFAELDPQLYGLRRSGRARNSNDKV
jgi:hypothetical protein